MLRSLYSGVSGMKAHQARMDVIGNNIANVNTYGFKGSRASFKDVYYQTLNSASGASGNSGGINPSQIGYGAQIGSVDVMQTRSTFQMTDNGMDVAIAGEGFFQVQDGDGNVFYTRAGMLNIDSAGNLVDMNGNFVLGVSGNPLGKKAAADKICVSVPSVNAAPGQAVESINNIEYTITSSNKTKDANITFNFLADYTLPGGQKAKADITTSGITIRLNATESFNDMNELNKVINDAITEANGGKEHPGGVFTIATDPANVFPGTVAIDGKVTGIENIKGTIEGIPETGIFGGMKINTANPTSLDFSASGDVTFSAVYGAAGAPDPADPERWEISAVIGGKTYEGVVDSAAEGVVRLTEAATGEYFEMTHPGITTMTANFTAGNGGTPPAGGDTYPLPGGTTITASANDLFLGGLRYVDTSLVFSASGNMTFNAEYVDAAGTPPDNTPEGWKITAKDASGKNYIGYVAKDAGAGSVRLEGPDDEYIEMMHPSFADMNLAGGFGTPAAGDKFTEETGLTAVASSPFIGEGLTGEQIISKDFSTTPGNLIGIPSDGILGGLKFKSTSSDFTGTGIMTFPDAVYESSPIPGGWKISATDDEGKEYVGYVTSNMTSPSTFLLKNEAGGSIEMSHPGFDALVAESNVPMGSDPVDGSTIALGTANVITAEPAKPSNCLGLTSKPIKLSDGTAGGSQSVADLSSIGIGADGVIEAIHPIHGRLQLGRIDVATFENAQALEQVGSTYFKVTSNSGEAKLCIPGSTGSGALAAGSLEMSNVDLSREFSDMITTQRGFQANSRLITVSDEMLEELVNLKR